MGTALMAREQHVGQCRWKRVTFKVFSWSNALGCQATYAERQGKLCLWGGARFPWVVELGDLLARLG